MNSQILPRFLSNELKKKMEIWGKDSIWELRVFVTCSMNAKNLPLYSHSLIKWKIRVNIAYGNLGY